MNRLNNTTNLPTQVKTPEYQYGDHNVGIVHIGIGAFHRGHMAVYTDDVMAQDGGDWRITGVSLRSAGVRDRLNPQNGLYTLVERSGEGEKLRVIGSVKNVLVAPEDPEAVISCLSRPETKIVSTTITEKGYLRDPASGALLCDHPDIVHDLNNPESPKTIHGFLVAALARIKAAGTTPFTPLCCDNLAANGASLKRVIIEFANLKDKSLGQWIAENVAFPDTMVDRIVPATTQEDIDAVAKTLGCVDEAPVLCEPFSQWVIANSLPQPRPAWEKFGVTFVDDVAPFEEMKLRLLNASHSAMAYLGYLGGHEYIHQVVGDPAYLKYVRTMMSEEMIPTLHMPEGVDLEAYCDSLIDRFSNPTLWHKTSQIAMDGSLKIPLRLLNTVRDRIANNQSYSRVAVAIAGWLRYITGVNEQGEAFEVSDPFCDRLQTIAKQYQDDIPGYVNAMIALEDIFGTDLPYDEDFIKTITTALQNIYNSGTAAVITAV